MKDIWWKTFGVKEKKAKTLENRKKNVVYA